MDQLREAEMNEYTLKHYNITWKMMKNLICKHKSANYSFCRPPPSLHNAQSDDEDGIIDPYLVPLFVTIVALFIVGILCNACMILTIRTSKKFRKAYWSYTENLAVMDILTLLSMLSFLFYLHFEPMNWPESVHKYLFSSLDMFLASGSMVFVVTLAVERAFSFIIWKPGQNIMQKTKLIASGIWLYSVVLLALGLSRMFMEPSKTFSDFLFWWSTACVFFISFTITFVAFMFITVYQVIQHFKKTKPLLQSSSRCKLRAKKSRMSAVMFVLAPLPFFLGWSFFLGVQTYEVAYGQVSSDVSLNIAMLVTPWIVATLNPIAFLCVSTKLRKTFCQRICSLLKALMKPTQKKHSTEQIV